ncbi:unnamed protein product [Protopolystoma xenopodis]|uniref:Uncharacterized protein n=1 Tax=Protopolystoma xenopodis TaxID=117903 RepID=A0A448WR28_9PLAT|nr:unnamed protein product [Protopolystoma xenopodis]
MFSSQEDKKTNQEMGDRDNFQRNSETSALSSFTKKYAPLSGPGCYELVCFCGRLYVAETGRTISQGLVEHANSRKGRCVERSQVAEHMIQTGSDNVRHMTNEGLVRLHRNVGRCLIDHINLNVVLRSNICSTTRVSRRLLARLTYESLHHVLPYGMKVFASISDIISKAHLDLA